MAYMLGKKLGVVYDHRTLALSTVMVERPQPPRRHTVAYHADFQVYRNDEIGDCGLASQGHRISAQERSAAQSSVPTITVKDVVAAYSAVGGYVEGRPETDNGVYLLDVCNYMRKTGMGREKDGSPHTVYAFAKVDPRDHEEVMLALWLFGGLYSGAALPLAAADQVGGLWDIIGSYRKDQFGSWGGHAMYVQGYHADNGPQFVTWGAKQFATWRWWDAYVDELYAFITEDFLRTRTQLTPQGFDRQRLDNYLASL